MNLPRRPRWLPTSLLASALVACSGAAPPTAPTEVRSEQVRVTAPALQDGDQATLTADDTRFAWDLYQAVRVRPGNLAFSPASVSLSLAMAFGGAQGTTADQMAATLHFSLPPARLHPTFDALDLALVNGGHIQLANALWARSAASVLPTYLDLLAESYGAGVHLVDFARAPETARAAMNQWVSDQTSGHIAELFPSGSINVRTVLALTNAVYFHDTWIIPFGAVNANGTFQTATGPVTTAMMTSAPPAPGWSGTGWRAVALPYEGLNTSLVLVVPDADTFDAFEAGLTADAFQALVTGASTTMYSVTMPRFTARTTLPLKSTLAAMGMTDAFGSSADFSGIDGTHDLFIEDVLHQAVVATDENGTTAAAATGVTFARKAAVEIATPLVVDRPFLFAIRDEATGTILFLGRVVDPTI